MINTHEILYRLGLVSLGVHAVGFVGLVWFLALIGRAHRDEQETMLLGDWTKCSRCERDIIRQESAPQYCYVCSKGGE